eukprot:3258371-Prorocentrum_lima.AAC.1
MASLSGVLSPTVCQPSEPLVCAKLPVSMGAPFAFFFCVSNWATDQSKFRLVTSIAVIAAIAAIA